MDRIGDQRGGALEPLLGALGPDRTLQLLEQLIEHLDIGVSVWRIDDPSSPEGLRLVGANPSHARLTGVALDAIGERLPRCFPAAAGTELPALLLGIDEAHPQRTLAACRLAQLPSPRTVAARAFALPDRHVGLALEDVTLRIRDQRLHFAERRALELVAAGAELEDVLAVIASVIEELAPETLASVHVLDRTGTRLVRGAAPSLPETLIRGLDGTEIGPTAGPCGVAVFRRDPVFVTDLETDPRWAAHRGLARTCGLRACWAMPILANDGRVLGTFAMHYRSARSPDRAAIELIERAAHVASIAIERHRLDTELGALAEHTDACPDGERAGVDRRSVDDHATERRPAGEGARSTA